MTRIVLCALLSAALMISCAQRKNLIPDNYKSWERTVKEVLKYPIPGHENNYRKIYINETGEKVIETKAPNRASSYKYPEGTIIVKEIYSSENYTEAATPQSLTCMVKDSKDPLSRGGWLWVMKSVPDGKERIIDFSFCITCHANANEPHPYGDHNPEGEFRDYVYFPYEKEEGD
jgi:hypothetical protein